MKLYHTGCLLGFVFFDGGPKIRNSCPILARFGLFERKHTRICYFDHENSNSCVKLKIFVLPKKQLFTSSTVLWVTPVCKKTVESR